LNYTISKDNVGEAAQFPRLARDVGAGIIFYRDLVTFDFGKYCKEDRLDKFSKEFRHRLREQILSEANQCGVHANLCESLFAIDQTRKKLCHRPWMSCFVDVLGNLYPCCHVTQKNTDITHFTYGNILKQRLNELWNIPEYQALRKGIVNPGPVPFLCRECDCLRK
jgi:radical SAM protein with 4Fe4S-binding SPASM domain